MTVAIHACGCDRTQATVARCAKAEGTSTNCPRPAPIVVDDTCDGHRAVLPQTDSETEAVPPLPPTPPPQKMKAKQSRMALVSTAALQATVANVNAWLVARGLEGQRIVRFTEGGLPVVRPIEEDEGAACSSSADK